MHLQFCKSSSVGPPLFPIYSVSKSAVAAPLSSALHGRDASRRQVHHHLRDSHRRIGHHQVFRRPIPGQAHSKYANKFSNPNRTYD